MQALKLDPEFCDAMNRAAILLRQLRDPEKAQEMGLDMPDSTLE